MDGALWVARLHADAPRRAPPQGSPGAPPVISQRWRVRFVNHPTCGSCTAGASWGPWGFPALRLRPARLRSVVVEPEALWTQPDWLLSERAAAFSLRQSRDSSPSFRFSPTCRRGHRLAAATATPTTRLIPHLGGRSSATIASSTKAPTRPRLAALDGEWVDEEMVGDIGIVVRANLELSDR